MQVMFLVHEQGDSVGVAVEDIPAGATAPGRLKDGDGAFEVAVTDDVPLGHKVALRDLADGEVVIEYGVEVGRTTQPVTRGQRVHTHNMKGQRWV